MGYIILLLLNLIAPLAGAGVILFFLFSSRRNLLKNLRTELGQRFAFGKGGRVPGGCIWLHAASVGEVRSCVGVTRLLKVYYSRPALITCTTAAGRAVAQKEPVFDIVALAPADFYPFIKKFIKIYKPFRLFIIESDLWPNMITACANNGVPVGIINGRLSRRSAGRYKLLWPLFKLVLSKISLICTQTEDIARLYAELGALRRKIRVCGNMKYDILNEDPPRQSETAARLAALGWAGAPIIACGSTHEEEERVIIAAAKKLPAAKFIIAPRHLERAGQTAQMLKESGIGYAVLSKIKERGVFNKPPQILLADAMGWLGAFYKAAAIVFVGGSISRRGGHNFLEAAVLGRPVLLGRYYYNAPEAAQKLLAEGGGFLVDADNFAEVVDKLLKQPAALQNAASAAGLAAQSFKGATDKTLSAIKEYERNAKT
ncbi:MAG: hypothetical protein LBG16_00690 [Elusimicrobiota bacterium]|jgi:3-deoxy-D-manno-octulosonic-acid transferase|nr:hypothetical protein [Elusimicrobiota bacterium]